MGLVDAVVGVLADYYGFDGGEGGVLGPVFFFFWWDVWRGG